MIRQHPLIVMFSRFVHHLTRTSLGLTLLITLGCATIAGSHWDELYGKATPREMGDGPSNAHLTYYQDTRPILEQRCVVCHGCYDAPCQLKLEAYEGLLRGANPAKVYSTRLTGDPLTRLFEDAHSTAEWRTKNFHPVLNERDNTPNANIKAGVMAQSLALKQQHPLPETAILPETFDFSLDSTQYCAGIETFESFAEDKPLWGMPYGLPGLSPEEHKITMDWLAQGAAMGTPKALPATITTQVAEWERFFNDASLKGQLVSRYIYEHLFLAHLTFAEAPDAHFRLVRSRTPPGEPLARISTSRPYDDPKVSRVYYRLWQDPSSIIAKTYMPYALSKARMERWHELFFSDAAATRYEVSRLPDYNAATTANPFVTFAELPINARYRFMLEEAQFTIMNFIKGPVCRGQVALNVIQDHFWVYFFSPETQGSELDSQFLADNSKHLSLPSEAGNTFRPLKNWLKYSEMQMEYLNAKAALVQSKAAGGGTKQGINIVWDGDKGTNPNAALTIFRHSDSASVHKGLIGEPPKTAWIIGYPLLERIHYLLVAGFDVYGNVSHQLLSRLYMDFLRIEGESGFIGLLPGDAQNAEFKSWYVNAEDNLQTYIDAYLGQLKVPTFLDYKTNQPKLELYQMLQKHIGSISQSPHNIEAPALPEYKRARYEKLQNIRGKSISFLPQTTIIYVPKVGLFTLVHNNAYTNLSSLFGEDERRIPGEDNLTIAQGVIGAYPNSFMKVEEHQLDDFIERVQKMDSERDYRVLRDIYGVRRSNSEFWAFSDLVHEIYRHNEPQEAALLDYNRLENR